MKEPLIFSNEGPLLTFIHANGYPLEAYQSTLNPLLSKFKVVGYSLRPFWPESDPADLRDWRDFRDDYLEFLEDFSLEGIAPRNSNEKKVIAVGHSVGAMTSLMAAIKQSDLFQALVLIEPVLFPPWQGHLMRLLSPFKLMRRFHPLILKTLRRKITFPNQDEMFNNYRGKPIFNRLSDNVLMDYVKGLSRKIPEGSVELKYSPEWEARIYETGGIADRIVWSNLKTVTCPVLVLRGEESDTLKDKTLQRMVNRIPDGFGVTIPGSGHLAPLEKPDQTAQLIIDFLESLQV